MSTQNQSNVLIIGGSGFIGNAIGERLSERGYKLRLLTRQSAQKLCLAYPARSYQWNGEDISPEALSGVDIVVNLAGQDIMEKAWSPETKKQILDSRIKSTKALATAIAQMEKKPGLVIQASAIGYYGMGASSGVRDENSSAGNDFLSEVCQQWEEAAAPIAQQSRLCIARIGFVLGWGGGALSKLWDVYCSGFGAVLGKGEQWMNWIHIQDLVHFVESAIEDTQYRGVYNLVAPENCSNQNFHNELCKHTRSLSPMKVPGSLLKIILGDRSNLVLNGSKVEARALQLQKFKFQFPTFDSAMNDLLSERVHRKAHYLKVQQWVPVSIDRVWEFIASANNLELLTPPWLEFKVQGLSTESIEEGTLISYKLKIHGVPVFWKSKITHWQPKVYFTDEQEKGPYGLWYHRHLFNPLAGGVLIEDRVEYNLPLFPLGYISWPFIKKDLKKIFDYRKQRISEIFCASALVPDSISE